MGKQKDDKNILTKGVIVITSCFGVGYIPLGGGTVASFIGLMLRLLIKDQIFFLLTTVFITCLAFFLSGWAERIFKEKDAKQIVIDDLAGMMVAFVFIPQHMGLIIATFFLFRAFDFLKVYPINKIEKLHGALGIVGDDVLAGVFAHIVMQLFRIVFKI